MHITRIYNQKEIGHDFLCVEVLSPFFFMCVNLMQHLWNHAERKSFNRPSRSRINYFSFLMNLCHENHKAENYKSTNNTLPKKKKKTLFSVVWVSVALYKTTLNNVVWTVNNAKKFEFWCHLNNKLC
jgi:hypothetical protein